MKELKKAISILGAGNSFDMVEDFMSHVEKELIAIGGSFVEEYFSYPGIEENIFSRNPTGEQIVASFIESTGLSSFGVSSRLSNSASAKITSLQESGNFYENVLLVILGSLAQQTIANYLTSHLRLMGD